VIGRDEGKRVKDKVIRIKIGIVGEVWSGVYLLKITLSQIQIYRSHLKVF
jgi:hypothetical protein